MEKINYLDELEAIWLGKGFTANGSKRMAEGDLVAIEHGGFIVSMYATHTVLGVYGNSSSSVFQVMLWDIIKCEVSLINLT